MTVTERERSLFAILLVIGLVIILAVVTLLAGVAFGPTSCDRGSVPALFTDCAS